MTQPNCTDLEILATGGAWSSTPWDYSSMRFLRFKSDGTGDLTYGYGQTIYAVMNCVAEFLPASRLRLTYLESPLSARSRFRYAPTDADRTKELGYSLVAGQFSGVESIVGWPFTYHLKLEFSESPFPNGLVFPHEVPLIYYGHRDQDLSGPKAVVPRSKTGST